MHTNQSPSVSRRRMTHVLAVCFTLAGLFTLVSLAVRGRVSQAVIEVKLSVEDPRPVAKAIKMLENKYGWVITYEDPRYVYDSDIIDVTLKVRKDLDKYKPGEAPKVLGPRGGILEFAYDVVPNTNLPPDPATVVQKMLDAQAARGDGGKFRLESSGKIMHVIPTAVKNSEGALVPQESVLDTIISLPAEDRTVYQKLESICAAISRAAKIPVELGAVPENWFRQSRDRQGAANQRARDVLVNTFATMEYGTDLSWQLFYSITFKKYLLHVHYVSRQGS